MGSGCSTFGGGSILGGVAFRGIWGVGMGLVWELVTCSGRAMEVS